jgi:hypothetical protein
VGGFSVVQTSHSIGASGNVRCESYPWWDKVTKTYKSVWRDNRQRCTEITTGIHGNSWVTELDDEAKGKRVHTTIHATMNHDHSIINEEFLNSYEGGPSKMETVSIYKRIGEKK